MSTDRTQHATAADSGTDARGQRRQVPPDAGAGGPLRQVRGRDALPASRLGATILADDDVADSAELSPATFAQAEEDIRAATTGKQGLLTRSVELDADALVVRATVLTYRWIDELQDAAYKTLGSIAGRAIGYLAPEVALGGAIVSAGLIETDALDRDGVASYLNELAESNPELMDHMAGVGGLLDGLQMRSLLAAGVMSSDQGAGAARGGLRAIGVQPFASDAVSALRDSAAGFAEEAEVVETDATAGEGTAPRTIEDLMTNLARADRRISVQRIGAGRYIAYLPGRRADEGGRLRLVGGDNASYVRQVVRAIEDAVADEPEARVMLVGSSHGGTAAAEIAAGRGLRRLRRRPGGHRRRPLGAGPDHPRPDTGAVAGGPRRPRRPARLAHQRRASATGSPSSTTARPSADTAPYVVGGRAADAAQHPEVRAEIARIQELGYLAG